MISYIANAETDGIIQKICKMKNILVLSSMNEELDIKQYMKEQKLLKVYIIFLNYMEKQELLYWQQIMMSKMQY